MRAHTALGLALVPGAAQMGMVVSIGVNESDGITIYNTQLLDADREQIRSAMYPGSG